MSGDATNFSVGANLPGRATMGDDPAQRGSLANDLGVLLRSGEESDISLVVGESQVAAHRAVLVARSPAFGPLLSAHQKQAEVTVPDLDEDLLVPLLTFLYTDQVPHLRSTARRLLVVAVRYKLPGLLEKCENQMIRNLCLENAAEFAVLAVKYSCPRLKKASVGFIRVHPEVMGTEGWTTELRRNKVIVEEMCRLVAETPSPSKLALPSSSSPYLLLVLAIAIFIGCFIFISPLREFVKVAGWSGGSSTIKTVFRTIKEIGSAEVDDSSGKTVLGYITNLLPNILERIVEMFTR